MRKFILLHHTLVRSRDGIMKLGNIKKIIIPVSRIKKIEETSDLNDLITEKVKNRVKESLSEDELGGSYIYYLNESDQLYSTYVLETPEAIMKRIYPE